MMVPMTELMRQREPPAAFRAATVDGDHALRAEHIRRRCVSAETVEHPFGTIKARMGAPTA